MRVTDIATSGGSGSNAGGRPELKVVAATTTQAMTMQVITTEAITLGRTGVTSCRGYSSQVAVGTHGSDSIGHNYIGHNYVGHDSGDARAGLYRP